MQVVILCGGKGTRLREHTERIPKPLVEIGPQPIVWHVIRWYAHWGIDRFILAAGYKGDQLREWVARAADAGDLGSARVDCVDTGLETPTGGRVHALRDRLREGPFLCTYADGLTDLRLPDLLATHRAHHGAVATLTAVRPFSPFGILHLDGDGLVRRFEEKPRMDQWINGGFFVFEPAILDHLSPDSVLERAPLEHIAAEGRLAAHCHEGFWTCMDTYKDHEALEEQWRRGGAPWEVWASGQLATGSRQQDGGRAPA